MTRVIAIENPAAGASGTSGSFRHMALSLQQFGIALERRATTGPGDGGRIAAALAAEHEVDPDLRCVMAVGGDGTIHEIAEGLVGRALPMMIWPAGTENLIAKHFGYRASPDRAIACITHGRPQSLDVGMAGNRSFLAVAGAGFDAEVVHRLVRTRDGHITHMAYTNPIWRTFWEHRFPCFRVYVENELAWTGPGMVFVGNIRRYSLGLRVVRDAVHDDGLLDMCIFPCRTRRQLVGHSLRTLARRQVDHGGVRYFRFKHARIESDVRVPLQLDGEAAGFLPVDFSIRPGAIHLLVPPARAGT